MVECFICCESMGDRIRVTLPCGAPDSEHIMCMRCFIHLQSRKCPFCRTPFEPNIPNLNKEVRANLIIYLQTATPASVNDEG